MTATKKCMETGEWFIHSKFQSYWTNYTQCSTSKESIITINVNVSQENKLLEVCLVFLFNKSPLTSEFVFSELFSYSENNGQNRVHSVFASSYGSTSDYDMF